MGGEGRSEHPGGLTEPPHPTSGCWAGMGSTSQSRVQVAFGGTSFPAPESKACRAGALGGSRPPKSGWECWAVCGDGVRWVPRYKHKLGRFAPLSPHQEPHSTLRVSWG